MLDNIAKGKLARFFKDNTLVNQDLSKTTNWALLTNDKDNPGNLLYIKKSDLKFKSLFFN
jgi:elongation factor Ts